MRVSARFAGRLGQLADDLRAHWPSRVGDPIVPGSMDDLAADAPSSQVPSEHAFSLAERNALYRAIFARRDVREFVPGVVLDAAALERIFRAAHHGPSVGFMQPWRFIRVRSRETRVRMADCVALERRATARALGEREAEFLALKVEGILECSEIVVVVLRPGREQDVFGRRTMPHMDLASTACAIENLWLAARAEGIGVGWVSIFEPRELARILGVPQGGECVAILCLGQAESFDDTPVLEQVGWRAREPLESVIFDECWPQGEMP